MRRQLPKLFLQLLGLFLTWCFALPMAVIQVPMVIMFGPRYLQRKGK